ncbi:MAG: helix-turn-helix domain-containing protein [Limisphaerales bacterium]
MSSHVDNVLTDEIVPRLRHLIPHHVSFVGAEDAEELLQDATLMAARLLASARAKGKQVTPGNVAFYTMLHIRCGRRSHSAGRSDAMGSRTQIMGLSRVTSLASPMPAPDDAPDESLTLGDMLASEAEDPAETAARNLDWQALVATLDERALAVLHCMADEARLQEVATRKGVSRSTVQSWRNQLTELVRSFMGADVLHLIQRTPQWRENLTVLREQMACRMDRRTA